MFTYFITRGQDNMSPPADCISFTTQLVPIHKIWRYYVTTFTTSLDPQLNSIKLISIIMQHCNIINKSFNI